jgi:hypothetical protein
MKNHAIVAKIAILLDKISQEFIEIFSLHKFPKDIQLINVLNKNKDYFCSWRKVSLSCKDGGKNLEYE